jgi:protease PrsW
MNKVRDNYKSAEILLGIKKSFYVTVGVFLLIILIINVISKDPFFNDLKEQVRFELKSNQPELAEMTYLKLISKDTNNVELHYKYIQTHFEIPKEKRINKYETKYRNDSPIITYYTTLSESSKIEIADIGNYGTGLIHVSLKEYDTALTFYAKVKNENLIYLNNSIGYIYKKKDSIALAEQYFRKEIKNNGNLDGAYSNLIGILYGKMDYNQLHDLLKDKEAGKHFSYRIERTVYFHRLEALNYIGIIFKQVFDWANMWGSIAAFLIMMIWIVYLRKLDVFEAEKWSFIVFTAVLGMLFSFATDFFTDINHIIFHFNLSGGVINDFFYCVFGIGFIEEFVKIIPLLLLLRFTKIINEPYDYILYASVSALGFAFVENLLYFDESSLHIIHGRALTAVVSHMFFSSIIAYGLILNRFKKKRNKYINLLLFFLLAALAHGFYDFWLINETVNGFSFITTIFFILNLIVWIRFINNALNYSSFFDEQKTIDASKLQNYLIYSLSAVLMFEYIALAFNYGPKVANNSLWTSLYSGTYLIAILSSSLSKLKLKQNKWEPINLSNFESSDYDNIIGEKLDLRPFSYNPEGDYLPNEGQIVKRIRISKEEPAWYLVKLNKPGYSHTFSKEYIIIKTKNKNERLHKGLKRFVAFGLVYEKEDLENIELKRSDFKVCGWATAN